MHTSLLYVWHSRCGYILFFFRCILGNEVCLPVAVCRTGRTNLQLSFLVATDIVCLYSFVNIKCQTDFFAYKKKPPGRRGKLEDSPGGIDKRTEEPYILFNYNVFSHVRQGGCLFYLRTKENPQAKVGAFKPEGFPIDYLII